MSVIAAREAEHRAGELRKRVEKLALLQDAPVEGRRKQHSFGAVADGHARDAVVERAKDFVLEDRVAAEDSRDSDRDDEIAADEFVVERFREKVELIASSQLSFSTRSIDAFAA